jgi:SPP1 gp7 family putative phage head morphogenesis protein
MSYWSDREEGFIEDRLLDDQKQSEKINAIYENAIKELTNDINAQYVSLANRTGEFDSDGFRERVDKFDVEAFNKKAAEYVANKDISAQAKRELQQYNAAMRINRLEFLKLNAQLELANAVSQSENAIINNNAAEFLKEAQRRMGVLGNNVIGDTKKLRTVANIVANSSFRGATFSERIWKDTKAVQKALDKILTQSMIKGSNPKAMASKLADEFGVSKYQADRLLRTEASRMSAGASLISIRNAGYKYFELVTHGATDFCLDVAGDSPYLLEDAKVGDNVNPLHPNCRCSTSPFVQKGFDERDLQPIDSSIEDQIKYLVATELMDAPSQAAIAGAGVIAESQLDDADDSGNMVDMNQDYIEAIQNGIISNKVNQYAQAKHDIPNDVSSYLEGVTLQEIIDLHGGTGRLTFNDDGSVVEFIDLPSAVGTYISKDQLVKAKSNLVQVVYNQDGAHGWPTKGGIINP